MIPRIIYWLSDLLVLMVAFTFAYLATPYLSTRLGPDGPWRVDWIVRSLGLTSGGGELVPIQQLLWVLLVSSSAVISVLSLFTDCERPIQQSQRKLILVSFAAVIAGLGLVSLVLFALKSQEWSRMMVFSYGLLSVLGLVLYRLILRHYFKMRQAAGYYAKNVIVVGGADGIAAIVKHFKEKVSDREYHILGCLLAAGAGQPGAAPGPKDTIHPDSPGDPQPIACLGSAGDIGELLIHRPITEVIAVHPQIAGGWITEVIRQCDYFRTPLWIVPDALINTKCQDLRVLSGKLDLPALILRPSETNSDELFLKRVLDMSVSALLLVMLLPLFLAVGLAIKLTTPSLPIFYPWRVVGFKGKKFTGYKFTTMHADADMKRIQLLGDNEMSGPVFKIKADPRVTPLGRVLRKYSINELPQLWSVLMGDMSLVGPRPAFPHELARYELWHKRKLSVRPGITCLWQVRGRNKISNFDDWVRMDLEYISNWSLWLDIKILFRTAWVVVRGTGS